MAELPEPSVVSLERAQQVASYLWARWQLPVEHSKLCGSCRRLEAEVGDLDILTARPAIPKVDPLHDTLYCDLISADEWDVMDPKLAKIPAGKLGIVTQGLKPGFGRVRCMITGRTGTWIKIEIHRHDLKLRPDGGVLQSNRGWIEMIRTGPAEWSKNMMIRWKALSDGGTSKDGYPISGLGVQYCPATEAEAFKLLRLPYCSPEQRGRVTFKLDPPADSEFLTTPEQTYGSLTEKTAGRDRNGRSGKGRGGKSSGSEVRGSNSATPEVAGALFNR